MATRSFIAIANPKGDYSAIYCHYDGYPEANGYGVGYTLKTHYKSKGKARALIRLGDISSLHENIAAIGDHSFESPQPGVTVAYGRDRGEKGCKARDFATVKELAEYASQSWAEFLYIFDGKRWHWSEIQAAMAGKPFHSFV